MWEWRVFGEPGELPGFGPGPFVEREDRYVLLEDTAATLGLKVRAHDDEALCELKALLERDEGGPRLWEKVFDRELPLSVHAVAELSTHLGRLPLGVATATADELARALSAQTVLVRKQVSKKYQTELGGTVERSLVTIGARRIVSVCVESPELARCREVGRALGLEGLKASSYPELLARL